MRHRKRVFSLVAAITGLVALACTCSLPKLSGPVPSATVPVSQEAANRMKQKLEQAKTQAATTGQFKATFTESEVTSYIVKQIESTQTEGETIPVANPQIKFTKGQVWIYGTFKTDSSSFNGLVVVSPKVQNGKLIVEVVRMDLGPIQVPKSLLEQVNEQIQSSLDEQLDQSSNLMLTDITIREGEIDVAGKVKK